MIGILFQHQPSTFSCPMLSPHEAILSAVWVNILGHRSSVLSLELQLLSVVVTGASVVVTRASIVCVISIDTNSWLVIKCY